MKIKIQQSYFLLLFCLFSFFNLQATDNPHITKQSLFTHLQCFEYLTVADLLTFGEDNCTSSEELVCKMALGNVSNFTLSDILQLPDTLRVDIDYLGTQEVTIFCIDEASNISSLTSYVIVKDFGDCFGDPTFYYFGGQLRDPYGRDIENATVAISGEIFNQATTTNSSGKYALEIDLGLELAVSASKEDELINGVSTFDIVLARQHILGTKPFDSPYQYFAADVNNSNTITTFDLVLMSKLILGTTAPFAKEDAWLFIVKDYEFQTANPLTENPPLQYSLSANTSSRTNLDFIGIKRGDINSSAKVNNLQHAEERTATPLPLTVKHLFLQKGKTYIIPFYFPETQPLMGFQLSIQTDNLHLKEINGQIIETGTFASNKIHSWIAKNNNQINLNWLQTDESAIGTFSLTFTANQSGYLRDLLQLNQRTFVNEGYTTDLEMMDIALVIEENEPLKNVFEASISPNPINLNHTLLTVENDSPTTLFVDILNMQGQQISTFQTLIPEGTFQQRLEIPAPAGTYWVQIYTAAGHLEQRKVVKL